MKPPGDGRLEDEGFEWAWGKNLKGKEALGLTGTLPILHHPASHTLEAAIAADKVMAVIRVSHDNGRSPRIPD